MDQIVTSRHEMSASPPIWPDAPAMLPMFSPPPPPRHVHVIWSLALGGAERIVADLARGFAECGTEADIVVLRDAAQEHAIAAATHPGITVHRLGKLAWQERRAFAAGVILASRLPAYCHLMSPGALAPLWRYGCRTVPVIHNTAAGWTWDPTLLDAVAEIPFVAACGEAVASALRAAGLRKTIRVLRHVVPAPPAMDAAHRARVRAAFGVAEGQVLLGMVGRFAPQKQIPCAIGLLAALRADGLDARLAIIGAADGPEAMACRQEADAQARRLGVRDHMVMPGALAAAGAVIPAFDVFLNTRRYEGVSVATMEAAASGVPVVGAAVGGQAEAVGPWDKLLDSDAPQASWIAAVRDALRRRPARPPEDRRARHMAAHVWPWLLAAGPAAARGVRRADIVFITGNLDVGGAQRSLCNLAAELAARGRSVTVGVCGTVGVPGFLTQAIAAGARFLDLPPCDGGGLHGRAGAVIALARHIAPASLAFWNMDAATKLMVAKAMAGGPVRLVDVSPGPMLYRELDEAAALGRALAFTPDQYLRALDVLVAKYDAGLPPPGRGRPACVAVIANGVPDWRPPLAPGDGPAPPVGADPALAVVTVGRLVAAKRPDLLPGVARALGRILPGATLTVVGGTHGVAGGWPDPRAAAGARPPGNLEFAGPDHRTGGFLGRFACFYMVSKDQGCPNASLEAMAAGLPVVANPDGGTAAQVEHGVTGILVADIADPIAHAEALAAALARVLRDPADATAMGAAGRLRARRHFSMAAMADRYERVLFDPEREIVAPCAP
jgi:glycosyltransferase involved in cell wall biosynthesis